MADNYLEDTCYSGRSMKAWPPPQYEIRINFRAPLGFAYRWCTDFSPRDPALEKGNYQRKIAERSRGRVVFEDLYPTKTGWQWYRVVVSPQPPDRWHAELRGNIPDWSVDYQMTPIRKDRTILTIRWRVRQRPPISGYRNPPKAALEGSMRKLWKEFGRSLERDYRRKLRRAGSRSRVR